MPRLSPLQRLLLCLALLLVNAAPLFAFDPGPFHIGPFYDQFGLTLAPGERTEAAGPFFYDEHRDTAHTWAIPPLFSKTVDPALPLVEIDFIYPILTYDRYGDQYRWQLFQLLSFAGGPTQTEQVRRRFTLFPIYFQQRSSDTNENYTAFLPFYGHLKHRLFRDEAYVVMFPFYLKTRKGDVITRNYVYPIYHVRHGPRLYGWQVFPFVGHEHKQLTTITNRFEELESTPGHDRRFVLWPFYFNAYSGLGTTNIAHQYGIIPAYALLRSPQRNSTTVLWPFFSHIDDREKKYREWDLPWPLIEFARGQGKYTSRVFPFYSHAYNTNLQSDFILWPVYKFNRVHSDTLDRRRTRIMFFLYSDTREKNTETGAFRRRMETPVFSKRRELNGNTRFQVLNLLEPFVSGSHKIERDYSPLWSVWRAERNAQTGATSQSLLWNLYRRQTAPGTKEVSAFFGLYQSKSDTNRACRKILFIPVGGKKTERAGISSRMQ